MSKNNEQPYRPPLASLLCSAFLVGFCANATAWRVDAGEMDSIAYPLAIGGLATVTLILQVASFRQNAHDVRSEMRNE